MSKEHEQNLEKSHEKNDKQDKSDTRLERFKKPAPPEMQKRSQVEAELLPRSDMLINATTIQLLIEKDDDIQKIERLLRAELDYNRERLAILRDNADLHPDKIEQRRTGKFRRAQYSVLLALLLIILAGLPFVPLAIASVFGIVCILIVAGVLLNARERDIDLKGFIEILRVILGGRKP